MAQKRVTDLPLIETVGDNFNIPGDNTIQAYRATALQIKNYVLAAGNVGLAALAESIFNGLNEVSPQHDDFITIVDTSDSNKTKKVIFSSVKTKRVRSVTTTDTPSASDDVLVCSGGSFTLTLPDATTMPGKVLSIHHAGTSNSQVYTINTTSGQTIGAFASGALALSQNSNCLVVLSNGSNWIILDIEISLLKAGDNEIIGGSILIHRSKRSITLQWNSLGHSSSSSRSTSSDFLPAWARPPETQRNVYFGDGNAFRNVSISTEGQMTFSYFTGANGAFNIHSSTATIAGNVTYLV